MLRDGGEAESGIMNLGLQLAANPNSGESHFHSGAHIDTS